MMTTVVDAPRAATFEWNLLGSGETIVKLGSEGWNLHLLRTTRGNNGRASARSHHAS